MAFDNSDHDFEQSHELLIPTPCVLLLNGFPGVGKFTIAKAIKTRLGNRPHRLLDSHLLIDPVVAIEPERNAAHYALRKAFRKTAFDGLKTIQDEKLVIMSMTCLSRSPLPTPYDDIDQFGDYVELAETRGVPLVVVNIACDLDTNRGRLCSKERKEIGGKTKLIDLGILEELGRTLPSWIGIRLWRIRR